MLRENYRSLYERDVRVSRPNDFNYILMYVQIFYETQVSSTVKLDIDIPGLTVLKRTFPTRFAVSACNSKTVS